MITVYRFDVASKYKSALIVAPSLAKAWAALIAHCDPQAPWEGERVHISVLRRSDSIKTHLRAADAETMGLVGTGYQIDAVAPLAKKRKRRQRPVVKEEPTGVFDDEHSIADHLACEGVARDVIDRIRYELNDG